MIVLMPGHGIVVVEVKGGSVSVDAQGGWRQSGGGGSREIDPVGQALKVKHEARRYVDADPRWGDSSRSRVKWLHSVVLPYSPVDDDFAQPGCSRDMVHGRDDQSKLAARLRALADAKERNFRVPALDDCTLIAEILTGRNLMRRDVMAEADDREARADRLTQIVVAAIVVGSTLQRVSGLGMGLVVAPLLALVLGASEGVLVANATTTVSALMLTVAVRRAVEWRRALLIGAAAVPGAVVGALLVGSLPPAALQVVVGAVVLVGLGTGWLVDHLGRLPHVRRWWVTPGAGLVGGALNTVAGVAGPAMIVHSRLVRWDQAGFAATMQPVFMTMGGLSRSSAPRPRAPRV